MIETVSNVYDLVYPSPVSLKEISSIVVAFGLWRHEIIKYCRSCASNEFHLIQKIVLKNVIPDVPPAIYDLLEEYTAKCRLSIAQWLAHHSMEIINFHRPNWNDLLKDFHDFAYDWNGSIHYVRTAKKMILCERISQEEKFRIACKYCFEDDVRRIWPSVSSKIDLNETEFNRSPLLYYWVCQLKNELDKIPIPPDEPIDEVMLDECRSDDWSSVEYFWNRIATEKQLQKAVELSMSSWEPLARFILPKLNDHQRDEFIAARGCDLIGALFTQSFDKSYVLPTWMFIKNKIDESSFVSLIEKLFDEETNYIIAKERLSPKDEAYICCEIWKTAPLKFRQSALQNILTNGELFERQCIKPLEPREMRFLITVLLDTSIEQRKKFLLENWRHVIIGARVEDLRGIIKLCIENEKEIAEFKQNTMGKFENIEQYCGELMEFGYFKELNEILTFCHPETKIRKEFTQRLLREKFLGEDSILGVGFFSRSKPLNEFIDDAFDNTDQAADFKNQFISAPVTENCLFECIRLGYFINLMEFVNTFVSEDQALGRLKERLLDSLKSHLIGGTIWQMDADHLRKIVIWCLGNADKVDEFKRSISADDAFRNMIQLELSSRYDDDSDVRYPSKFDEFLKWYFASSEEIEKFIERFSNELKMFSRR